MQKQEKLKNEEIEITFSYWDGSGHRRSVKMKKGNSIYQFLQVRIFAYLYVLANAPFVPKGEKNASNLISEK